MLPTLYIVIVIRLLPCASCPAFRPRSAGFVLWLRFSMLSASFRSCCDMTVPASVSKVQALWGDEYIHFAPVQLCILCALRSPLSSQLIYQPRYVRHASVSCGSCISKRLMVSAILPAQYTQHIVLRLGNIHTVSAAWFILVS